MVVDERIDAAIVKATDVHELLISALKSRVPATGYTTVAVVLQSVFPLGQVVPESYAEHTSVPSFLHGVVPEHTGLHEVSKYFASSVRG